MNKGGVLGLDVVRSVILTLLLLVVTSVAVMLALVAISNSNIFGGPGAANVALNGTQTIITNVTTSLIGFFNNVPTIMTVLGAVVIILVVVLIIVAISRFSSSANAGGGI